MNPENNYAPMDLPEHMASTSHLEFLKKAKQAKELLSNLKPIFSSYAESMNILANYIKRFNPTLIQDIKHKRKTESFIEVYPSIDSETKQLTSPHKRHEREIGEPSFYYEYAPESAQKITEFEDGLAEKLVNYSMNLKNILIHESYIAELKHECNELEQELVEKKEKMIKTRKEKEKHLEHFEKSIYRIDESIAKELQLIETSAISSGCAGEEFAKEPLLKASAFIKTLDEKYENALQHLDETSQKDAEKFKDLRKEFMELEIEYMESWEEMNQASKGLEQALLNCEEIKAKNKGYALPCNRRICKNEIINEKLYLSKKISELESSELIDCKRIEKNPFLKIYNFFYKIFELDKKRNHHIKYELLNKAVIEGWKKEEVEEKYEKIVNSINESLSPEKKFIVPAASSLGEEKEEISALTVKKFELPLIITDLTDELLDKLQKRFPDEVSHISFLKKTEDFFKNEDPITLKGIGSNEFFEYANYLLKNQDSECVNHCMSTLKPMTYAPAATISGFLKESLKLALEENQFSELKKGIVPAFLPENISIGSRIKFIRV